VIPVAAFTAIFNASLDCEQPDGTPVITDVTGPGAVGPIINEGQKLTILSPGDVKIPNPGCNSRFDPACAPQITRDYGFGATKGTVKIGGVEIPPANVTWTNKTISVTVPAGILTGQLEVTRGDNGKAAVTGITVTVGPLPPGQSVMTVTPGQSIQAAIDLANPGDLIIVRPGKYDENIIMNKKVKLQGSSAFSTVINSAPTLPENLQNFRQRVQTLIDAGLAQLVPGENIDLHLEFGAVTVIPVDGTFTQADNARIDGFSMTSATSGGAVTVNGFAHYLQISNNRMINNAGAYGGGIRLGTPGLIDPGTLNYTDNLNDNITIHHNQILMNGSVGATTGGGGVAIHNGSTNYQVTDNYICGNFTTSKGAGISHVGLSDGGLIARNKILLNESSFNSIQGGEGGGIIIRGEPALAPAVLTPGTGDVQVLSNLIQGNLAGNGKGGGVFVSFANGLDVQASPGDSATWYGIDIFNNMIVNNVAGWVGGGIYLEDAAKVRIVHNTIANNSSTSTGAGALLPVGINQPTVPTGAGVVGGIHSAGLAALLAGQAHSDPLLQNNIIWHNASFGYLPDPNNPLAGLFPDPANPAGFSFWDLQVFNSAIEPAPVPGGLVLHPFNSVLTNLIGPDGVDYTGNGNLDGTNPLFMTDFVYTLQTASAPGEGGNTVQVTFTPIGPMGDYHLQELSTVRGIAPDPVIPEVATDYDGEDRLFPAATGADEFYPPTALTFGDLTLLGPKGTPVIRTGSTQTITWQAPATFPVGVTYRLQVSYNNGGTWATIPGAEALSAKTFDWVVPARNSNAKQSLLRVQAFDGQTKIGEDTSLEPFEVEAVKMLYPSDARVEVMAGLTLAPPYGINWRLNDVKKIIAKARIEISKDGGATWKKAVIAEGNPILNPVEGQEYQLTWTVPDVGKTKTKAKVRVLLFDKAGNEIGRDQNDVPFTIYPAP